MAVAFHWHQGRRRQALAIAEPSVAAHRAVGPGELRKALLLLRAELRAVSADLDPGGRDGALPGRGAAAKTRAGLEAALADVEEVRDLLDGAPEGEAAAVVGLWSRILVLIGDRAEMAVALPQARRLATPGDELEAATLLWLEGHAEAAPELLWRQARERFTALGDDLWVARASLDLARLHLSRQGASEAAAQASEVANRLGAVVTAPEDLAALKMLGRAARPAGEVASADLDRVECVLKRLEWQRRSNRALQLSL